MQHCAHAAEIVDSFFSLLGGGCCRYIFLSYRVFIITAALRDVVIPKEGGAALLRRAVIVAVVLISFYGLAGFASPTILGPASAAVPPPPKP